MTANELIKAVESDDIFSRRALANISNENTSALLDAELRLRDAAPLLAKMVKRAMQHCDCCRHECINDIWEKCTCHVAEIDAIAEAGK